MLHHGFVYIMVIMRCAAVEMHHRQDPSMCAAISDDTIMVKNDEITFSAAHGDKVIVPLHPGSDICCCAARSMWTLQTSPQGARKGGSSSM